MDLSTLVTAFSSIAATRSRNAKRDLLAAALVAAPDAATLGVATAYLSGQLPLGKIGIGPAALRALDLPEPASAASLTLADTEAAWERVRSARGAGSKAAKAEALQDVLSRATAAEQTFLLRLLGGELRQGALDGVLRAGIAKAFDASLEKVQRAAMFSGDVAEVARVAREHGDAGLDAFRLRLFRPLEPMLAQSASSAEDALAALDGDALFEHKLDGARIQVHREGDTVRVFTRSLREVTRAVPEVVEAVLELEADSAVLDGEVLALWADGDRADRPRPFQDTMRRFGREQGSRTLRAELPLTPFFFDVLHVDGTDLVDAPLAERRRALEAAVPERFLVPSIRPADAAAAESFFDAALDAGHEGVVAKAARSAYEAGRRGAAWIKVKPAHTLDLVVLAAEWGSGRREGTLSNLWLGARDESTGDLVMLGKTFKGLTDDVLAWQTEQLLARETRREEHVVFVRPELVVEIAFDGLQRSSEYPGGLALRFARVKRYREDKSVDGADTMAAVRALAPT